MIFSNQLDQGEKVSVIVRKHWLMYLLNIIVLVVTALIPLILGAIAPESIKSGFVASGFSGAFLLFIYQLFVLLLWLLAFVSWTTYFLDTWVVTNRRIIAVDQKVLFERVVTTLMLERIQDVTIDIDGLLPTLFGFGTLTIRTAGEGEDIVIRFAAHPGFAKDRILEAQSMALQRRSNEGL